MAKLKAPEGVCSFSHDGQEYEIKRGSVEVPDDALPVALLHGFTVPAQRAKAEAEQE